MMMLDVAAKGMVQLGTWALNATKNFGWTSYNVVLHFRIALMLHILIRTEIIP